MKKFAPRCCIQMLEAEYYYAYGRLPHPTPGSSLPHMYVPEPHFAYQTPPLRYPSTPYGANAYAPRYHATPSPRTPAPVFVPYLPPSPLAPVVYRPATPSHDAPPPAIASLYQRPAAVPSAPATPPNTSGLSHPGAPQADVLSHRGSWHQAEPGRTFAAAPEVEPGQSFLLPDEDEPPPQCIAGRHPKRDVIIFVLCLAGIALMSTGCALHSWSTDRLHDVGLWEICTTIMGVYSCYAWQDTIYTACHPIVSATAAMTILTIALYFVLACFVPFMFFGLPPHKQRVMEFIAMLLALLILLGGTLAWLLWIFFAENGACWAGATLKGYSTSWILVTVGWALAVPICFMLTQMLAAWPIQSRPPKSKMTMLGPIQSSSASDTYSSDGAPTRASGSEPPSRARTPPPGAVGAAR